MQLADEQLVRTPDSLELRTRRILMLAKRGDCAAARDAAAALDAVEPCPTEQYRVAVAWEVCGDRAVALAALIRSITAGYPLEQVNRDPDLAAVRDNVEFHRFLAGRPPSQSPVKR